MLPPIVISKSASTAKNLLGTVGGWLGRNILGIGAGLSSARAARERNRAQIAMAREQMAFQERMSSTSHQREMKDLIAAGLNPILTATGGKGASTPGGAMAPIQDEAANAINTALSVTRAKTEIKNIQAQTLLTEAQTKAIQPAAKAGEGIESAVDWVTGELKTTDYQNMAEMFLKDMKRMGHSAKSMAGWPTKLKSQFKTWLRNLPRYKDRNPNL